MSELKNMSHEANALRLGAAHELTPLDVVDVARMGRRVEASPDTYAALRTARAVLERWIQEGRPLYGVNRGLGRNSESSVSLVENLDATILRARALGAGEPLPTEVVRAAMVCRIAGFAQGKSGVRPEVMDALIAALNAGVHPIVPSVGTLGASDIMLGANLALPLIGEGRAQFRGQVMEGREALRRAGLEPLILQSKEGIALCSSNAITAGSASLRVVDAASLLDVADASSTLMLEAFRGNTSPIHADVAEARNAPGQAQASSTLRSLLSGSDLFSEGQPRRLQDPVSFRVASQVHGAARVSLGWAQDALAAELNGSSDNPAVLADIDQILPNGNFHTPALAIAFDALGLALYQVGFLISQRLGRLMTSRLSGLPEGLSERGQGNVAYTLLSLTSVTLVKEIRRSVSPATLDISASHEVEDHAPMAPMAVSNTARALEMFPDLLACELIAAAGAIRLEPRQLSNLATAMIEQLEQLSPPMTDDRSLAPDVERVAAWIRSGAAAALVQRHKLPTN